MFATHRFKCLNYWPNKMLEITSGELICFQYMNDSLVFTRRFIYLFQMKERRKKKSVMRHVNKVLCLLRKNILVLFSILNQKFWSIDFVLTQNTKTKKKGKLKISKKERKKIK